MLKMLNTVTLVWRSHSAIVLTGELVFNIQQFFPTLCMGFFTVLLCLIKVKTIHDRESANSSAFEGEIN